MLFWIHIRVGRKLFVYKVYCLIERIWFPVERSTISSIRQGYVYFRDSVWEGCLYILLHGLNIFQEDEIEGCINGIEVR